MGDSSGSRTAPQGSGTGRRRLAHVFDSGVVATIDRNVRSARRATVAVVGLALFGAAGYGVTTIERAPNGLAAIQVDSVEAVALTAFETARQEVPSLADAHP